MIERVHQKLETFSTTHPKTANNLYNFGYYNPVSWALRITGKSVGLDGFIRTVRGNIEQGKGIGLGSAVSAGIMQFIAPSLISEFLDEAYGNRENGFQASVGEARAGIGIVGDAAINMWGLGNIHNIALTLGLTAGSGILFIPVKIATNAIEHTLRGIGGILTLPARRKEKKALHAS